MEKDPKKEDFIDTEKGVEMAQESFGVNDKLESDLVARAQEAEMMEDPSEKINTLLRLSIEAKRNGFDDMHKNLRERALKLDTENSAFFDSEAKFKAAKLLDEVVRMETEGKKVFSGTKNEYIKEIERDEVPQEIPKNEISVTQAARKKIMSTLKTFFSL